MPCGGDPRRQLTQGMTPPLTEPPALPLSGPALGSWLGGAETGLDEPPEEPPLEALGTLGALVVARPTAIWTWPDWMAGSATAVAPNMSATFLASASAPVP